jgi:CHAT domain-containing protein
MGGDRIRLAIHGPAKTAYYSDRLLDKANAVPDVVLAGLKGKTYWHFATHGVFDWKDAQQTGLLMKDNARLTVGALFEARAGLGTPRLVVLSACETGLYDADRNPGEFVGLPAAFLQLGAGGVIASLWQVDDLATALLMSKFYDLNFDKGLAPSAALKQAKAWLRNATRRELIAYAKAVSKRAHAQQTQLPDLVAALRTGRRSAGSRFRGIWDVLGLGGGHKSATAKPFAHPYYWSGFVYTGG